MLGIWLAAACHELLCWLAGVERIGCDMQEQLAAVRAIAEPLRVRLDIPPMQQHFQQLQSLEKLPQPLHTAFLQLRAAQEAFGLPADISIAGVHNLLTTELWGQTPTSVARQTLHHQASSNATHFVATVSCPGLSALV